MYSFGAMLSFTIAHASVIRCAASSRDEELVYRARPNLRWRGVDWPLFAVFGGLGTGLSWLVVVVQDARDALRRPRLARGRVRHLRHLPAAAARAADARRCARRSRSAPAWRSSTATCSSRSCTGASPRRRWTWPAASPPSAARRSSRVTRARGAARAAARRRAARGGGAAGERAARRGARDRGRLRRRRRSAGSSARAAPAARSSTRPTRRNSEIIVHGRPAARRPRRQRADLRRHGRLRAQERAVPRDGRGRAERPRERSTARSCTIFGVVAIGLGIALIVQTARQGGGVGYLIGALFIGLGAGRLYLLSDAGRRPPGVARRGAEDSRAPAGPRRARALLGRLRRDRLLDLLRARDHRPARARPHARGARARRRCSSCVVALSYAEGTTAIPETGGAATFVRRAFNDLAGFLTGWALFLDYLIVIALSALFVPHYLGARHRMATRSSTTRGTWSSASCVIMGVALVRLVRRSAFYRSAIVVAGRSTSSRS